MKLITFEINELNNILNKAADADTSEERYSILSNFLENNLGNAIECKSIEYKK